MKSKKYNRNKVGEYATQWVYKKISIKHLKCIQSVIPDLWNIWRFNYYRVLV